MRIDFKRRSLMVRLAALALLAFFFIQANVHATQPINSRAAQAVVFVGGWGASVGLARGQTLRVNVSNENEPGARSGSEPVFALATLYDARGNTLAQSAEVAMRAGEFRSLDFNRDDLHLTGEPGTGRVQVRAQIRYRSFFIVDRTQLTPPALEVIDKSSGKTNIAVLAYRANDRLSNSGPGANYLGIVPGQTLRVTMFNPSEPGSPAGREPLRARVKLYDAHGNLIAESAEVRIAAGQFHSFDFNRADLPLAGEPGTSRAEIRTTALWGVRARHSFGPDDIPASLEIVDNGTGQTTAALSSKPKEIVVVGS